VGGRPLLASSSSQARDHAIVEVSESASGRPMPRLANHALPMMQV